MNTDGSAAPNMLNVVQVPTPWLSPPDQALAAGWRLAAPSATAGYTSAKVSTGGVTLNTSSGPAHYYRWNGSSYTPPDGQSGTARWASEVGVKVLKVADGEVTYTFDRARQPGVEHGWPRSD